MLRLLIVLPSLLVAIVLSGCLGSVSQAAPPPASKARQSEQTSPDQSPPVLPTVNDWKARSYPGSPITIDNMVAETDAYIQYVTSYYSDGLRISALLTVPKGTMPPNGWPVFVWNHGGADPQKYGRQNDDDLGKQFASRGYLTFQPAYRGFAGSDGDPTDNSGPGIDSLNAIASIKNHPGVDGSKIAVGGHSLGGSVTLFDVVVSQDIKAAVTVAGTFVSFPESVEQAAQVAAARTLSAPEQERWKPIEALIKTHGSPSENPEFWAQFDFLAHLSEISAPMQIHHGIKDEAVTWQQSQRLYDGLVQLKKPAELHTYPEGDHQLTGYTQLLFTRIVEFLDRHLKV